VAWLDLDEVANRVVVGLEAADDPGAVRALARDAGVPAEALEFERNAPYVAQSTLQDQFRPIQGGIQIQRVSGTSRASCTLGFAALWNNQQVFLTAGHCSPNLMATDNVEQFQPTAPLTAADSATMMGIGREIFRYSEACGSGRCAYSDAAIYGPVPSPAWRLGRIAQPSIGCFPGPCSPPAIEVSAYWSHWVIDTTHASFIVNDLVSQIGSATGWSQGYVSRTCVDVTPSHGVTYRCQMFAGYGASDGDSGSPILLDIMGGPDSTVTLGGIHSGKSARNAVFSPWSGIVQDYGSLVVAPQVQDTARPAIPPLPILPADSTYTVEGPNYPRSQLLYYRNIVRISFDDSTGGLSIRNLLARYNGTIIGGIAGPADPEYFIQVPDPGTTFQALDSLVDQLSREPGVRWAAQVYYRTPGKIYWRRPNDGPGAQRRDWFSPTNATRPLLAIRAPLAWGCETGNYGSVRPKVGVVDYVFDVNQPDLSGTIVEPPDTGTPRPHAKVLDDTTYRSHGTAVAGVLAASGDNGVGTTGVLWQSDLTMYRYSHNDWLYPDLGALLKWYLNDAVQNGVRVLVFSHSFGDVGNETHVRILRDAFAPYLRGGGLLVMATGHKLGEPGRTMTVPQLATTHDTVLHALHRAVAQLYDSGYANNIIFVGGTDDSGNFWPPSNYWMGATVLAPATNILTLANTGDFPAGTWTVSGTSWSAPYVAGVAGLLLAMDPTLTAAQVKGYIVRGDTQPRLNPQTGVFGPPQPVAGAPETVYQLDAYGALTLLASERSGVPLCGNRVWVAGTQLVAQRDPGAAPQVLADIGDTAAFVNVHHGGRRVDIWTNDFDPLSFVFTQQGTWTQSGNPPASPDGGAWNSLWSLSHDGDTAVTLVTHTGAGQDTLELRRGPTGGSSTHLADIVVPLSSSADSVCIYLLNGVCQEYGFTGTSEFVYFRTAAYSPLGDRVIVSVSTARSQTTSVGGLAVCPWDTNPQQPTRCITHIDHSMGTIGTTYHQIDLRTGIDTVLATPTTAPVVVFWSALAEDGGQLVTGEGVVSQTYTLLPDTNFVGFHTVINSQTTTACTLRYRQASSGLTPRYETASEDVCRGPLGGGSIAPAPPITSRTH